MELSLRLSFQLSRNLRGYTVGTCHTPKFQILEYD
jgi:elongation factor P--beta-lysine ligase